MLHLHTSNQSPETFQFGTFLVVVLDAALGFDAKGSILALHPVDHSRVI
jgi:hypothetical protein